MGLDGVSRDLLCAWVFILSRSKCWSMYVWWVVPVGRSGVCSRGVERPYIERVVEFSAPIGTGSAHFRVLSLSLGLESTS